MSPSYLYKIVTVGSAGVGKTSIILRYTTGVFRDFYTPTLGADFAIKNLQYENDKVKLLIWDLGSQDFLGKVRRGFYPGAKGVVFMFDVTNRPSFENLWKWKEEVDMYLKGYECLVLANKTDLETKRVVSQDEGIEIAGKFSGMYLETSVKLNKKVDDAFSTIAKMVMDS
ncbi:MAG: Rab family GTPase [Candidatus Thorarchaeota archaeon]